MADLRELTVKVGQVSDIYAERNGIARDDDWYALKLQEELGELMADYLRLTGRGRAKGKEPAVIAQTMADEAADVLAQLLLFCQRHGIDIEAALERKWLRFLDKTKTEPVTR